MEHLLRQAKLIRNSHPKYLIIIFIYIISIILTASGYDFLFMSPEEQVII